MVKQKVFSITTDSAIYADFRIQCYKKGVKPSSVINGFIKSWLKENQAPSSAAVPVAARSSPAAGSGSAAHTNPNRVPPGTGFGTRVGAASVAEPKKASTPRGGEVPGSSESGETF